MVFITRQSNAQTLIQYWDFNHIRPLSGSGGDSLGTAISYDSTNSHYGYDTLHATWPLNPSYSKVAGAKILYLRPGLTHYNPTERDSILDGVGGDGTNSGNNGSFIFNFAADPTYFSSSDSGFASVGNGYIKARNPSDSCTMDFYLPTTGYQGITFEFAFTQSSVKGAAYNIFSYSTVPMVEPTGRT